MTYANPLLTADTTGKIFVMIALAFLGAFNRSQRQHATLLLAVGHGVATACVLLLRAKNPLGPHRDILLSSAMVDAACAVVFVVLALRARKLNDAHAPVSVDKFAVAPFAAGGLALGFGLLILTARLHGGGPPAVAALYAQPDPMVGNALTLHFTLAAVLLTASVSARSRGALLSAARFAAGAALVAVFLTACIVGHFVATNDGARIDVSVALVAHVAVLAAIVVAATSHRFAATSGENARTRWLFEAALPALLAFRPPLPFMSTDERRYYLARYVYRSPDARAAALCPEIANTAFAIGAAVDRTLASRSDAATA